MGTNTPNHSFYKPASGETGWGDEKNSDYDDLDTKLILKDTASNRPAAGTADRWFLATDTGNLSYDNGTSWERIASMDVTDGTDTVTSPTELNFGTDLDLVDDGDGTATVNFDSSASTSVHSDWLNAVDDLGMDDTGGTAVDTIYDNNVANNTVMYFPEGTYWFDEGHYHPDTVNFKVIGDNATIKIKSTFSGNSTTGEAILWNWGQGGSTASTNIQVRGFDIDFTDTGAGCGIWDGYLEGFHNYFGDIRVNGDRDDSHPAAIQVNGNAATVDDRIVFEDITMLDGSSITNDPTAFHTASSSDGIVVFNRCAVADFNDNGFYMSNAEGPIHILNSYARDNRVANFRVGGDSSLVYGCYSEQTDRANDFIRGYRFRNGNSTVIQCYGTRSGAEGDEMVQVRPEAEMVVMRDCTFENSSTATDAPIRVEDNVADGQHPRLFEGCKFVCDTAPSGANTSVIENDADYVTFRDCEIDADVGGTDHWEGLVNTGDKLSVEGGKYVTDTDPIDDRGGADVTVKHVRLADAVTTNVSGVDFAGTDPVFIGRESHIENGVDTSGTTRPMKNNVVLDSGTADAPTPGDYEPGVFVEWTDTTDGTGDGTYLVSHDGTSVTGPI